MKNAVQWNAIKAFSEKQQFVGYQNWWRKLPDYSATREEYLNFFYRFFTNQFFENKGEGIDTAIALIKISKNKTGAKKNPEATHILSTLRDNYWVNVYPFSQERMSIHFLK